MLRAKNEPGIKRRICMANTAVKNTKKEFTSNESNKIGEVKVKVRYISARLLPCQTLAAISMKIGKAAGVDDVT